jgi:hypothetical protein
MSYIGQPIGSLPVNLTRELVQPNPLGIAINDYGGWGPNYGGWRVGNMDNLFYIYQLDGFGLIYTGVQHNSIKDTMSNFADRLSSNVGWG